MESDPETELEKAPRNDTRAIRALLSLFLFSVLIPTLLFGYPEKAYPSLVEWWDEGQAQLSVASAKAALARFFGNDAVSGLFSAGTFFIVKNTIPLWNGIVTHGIVRIVLAVLLSGAIYDLAKTAFNKVYGERRGGSA